MDLWKHGKHMNTSVHDVEVSRRGSLVLVVYYTGVQAVVLGGYRLKHNCSFAISKIHWSVGGDQKHLAIFQPCYFSS